MKCYVCGDACIDTWDIFPLCNTHLQQIKDEEDAFYDNVSQALDNFFNNNT